MSWPDSPEALRRLQAEIGAQAPPAWSPPDGELRIGGCFVCFPRGISGPGAAGEPAWAAAVVLRGENIEAKALVQGVSGAAYEAGLLAMREGGLLEAAVRALPLRPDVLLVNGTGRDHPRRCGLAVHLGVILDLPTAGVTHRPLVAEGDEPPNHRGATTPLLVNGEHAGYWLRALPGTRALAVHAGWRTSPEVALAVVMGSLWGSRTPEPLRRARELARSARANAG